VTDPGRTVALVLAAGAARRYGSPKALALLDGRPLLQHVVDVATELGLAGTVVVLGEDADAIDAAVDWRSADVVRNPHPDTGLAGSVRVGLDAVRERQPGADAVLVLLGDQPLVRPAVVRALLGADRPPGRAVVVPRYATGGGPNPALVHLEAWHLVDHVAGDRGLGPVLARHPEVVVEVAVEGDNLDVDTPADLALAAWALRVRGNREQVDRHREVPDGPDFYGPVSDLFVADPDRTDDAQLDALLALARPEDTWLDIGAGAGRFALPLARRVREVIALDPSTGMLDALRIGMERHGIANILVVEGRWPVERLPDGRPPAADVALMAHLGYDIEAIGPFLEAMEAAAGRRCVAILMARQPSGAVDPFWPPIHGEARVPLPGLDDFVELLRLRGRDPRVVETARPPRGFDTRELLERFARRQLWIAEGGPSDRRFAELVERVAVERDGRWFLEDRPARVGIVDWAPR
jgi:CTP:molybdopterin cytidylyltransferase MocA/SAM-dependent methyltransferase